MLCYDKTGKAMSSHKIIEPIGFIVAGVTTFFSLWLFYSDNDKFLGSLWAAFIAGGLVWTSYVIVRMLWLALRR